MLVNQFALNTDALNGETPGFIPPAPPNGDTALVDGAVVNGVALNGNGQPPPIPDYSSPYCINGAPLNVYPINGPGVDFVEGMVVSQVVDCRNLVVQFTTTYDHFKALNAFNWGISLGVFVESVQHLSGNFYAINCTRCLAGVLYTITANV